MMQMVTQKSSCGVTSGWNYSKVTAYMQDFYPVINTICFAMRVYDQVLLFTWWITKLNHSVFLHTYSYSYIVVP